MSELSKRLLEHDHSVELERLNDMLNDTSSLTYGELTASDALPILTSVGKEIREIK